MKKWIILSLLTIAILAVAAFAWSGTVFARNLNNNFGPYGHGIMNGYGYGHGYGHGMMDGYGYGYSYGHGMIDEYGYGHDYDHGMMGEGYDSFMQEYMLNGFADALNLSPEDIDARIQAGETPWQIARAEGLSDDQIQELMLDAQDQALQEAVDTGELTQEQADWMDQHMDSMWSGNFENFYNCHNAEGWNNSTYSNPERHYHPMMGGRWGSSF